LKRHRPSQWRCGRWRFGDGFFSRRFKLRFGYRLGLNGRGCCFRRWLDTRLRRPALAHELQNLFDAWAFRHAPLPP
jgi:hypothetical protein